MTDEELVKRLRNAKATQDFRHTLEDEAADRIEALTAERDEHWKSFVHWRKEADDRTEQLEAARADAKEAEAYAEELEAKVKNLTKHHSNMADPRYWEGRYRDEKAKLARAVEALRKLHHAVCGETGFAACVRLVSGLAYPWPALDEADEMTRATLAEIEGEKG